MDWLFPPACGLLLEVMARPLLLSSSVQLRLNFLWSLWVFWNKRTSSKTASRVLFLREGHSSLTQATWVLSNKPPSMPQFTHLQNGFNNTYRLYVLWGYSAVMHLPITTWEGNNCCVCKHNSISTWLAWHLSSSYTALGAVPFSITLPRLSCYRNRWHFDILHASNL